MTTCQDICKRWFDEARAMGITRSGDGERYIWSYPFEVKIGSDENLEYGNSRAIWDGGVQIELKHVIPLSAELQIRRISSAEEPWVKIRVDRAAATADSSLIDASFDV